MPIFLRNKVWWLDYRDPHGRRVRESSGTPLKTEALAILAARATKVREGKFFDIRQEEKIKFKDLLSQVLVHQEKKGLRSFTSYFARYASGLEKHFGEMYLNEITPKVLEDYQYLRRKNVAPATANRSLAVMRRAFNLGIRWGLTKENPVTKVDFFKEPKGRLRFLDRAEQADLMAQCIEPMKDLVLVALRTGMRLGELLNLRKADLDFPKGLIYAVKTKSGLPREIPMVDVVKAVLTKLAFGLAPEEHIFRSRRGTPYKAVRTGYTNALARAGIRGACFHTLRHTYASDLVMAGVDIFTVSKLLGHANVTTTMIYAHLSPDHKKAEMARYQRYLAEDGTKLAQMGFG